jgi:hypothetical protein
MNHIWTISIEDYLIIMEEAIILGTERGKVKGDNLEQEFFEIAEKKGLADKIKKLGTTEMTKDLIIGNIRDESSGKIKILDLTNKENHNE